MSNMEELRYLTDVANDPALANAKRKFKKGLKKLKQKLKRGTRKATELVIKRIWQRDISGNQIIKYGQFDPELATVIIVSVRPEHLGGHVILVDGQHTALMDIFGECNHEHDSLELHHPPDATLEEVQEKEARLYKALNTQQKKLSTLDIIRVDIFLEETYAVRFEKILQLCDLNLDGIGASNGTIVPGSGARMIKCISQFGEDFSSYIVRAVSFMRDKWGTEESPLLNIEDSMVHGLTTLFVFLDKAGQVEGGTTNGLNGKKKHFQQWMNAEMGRTSMRKYYHNTAGGNTHFKICHQILREYNFWAQENAPTMTISHECLHQNGILDPNVMLTKKERKNLPSFPSDITK